MPSLTDLAIRSAAPGTTLWDTVVRGLGCRIGKTRRTFIILTGPGRRRSIGHHGLMTLAEARAEARRRLALKMLGHLEPTRTAYDDVVAEFLEDCARRLKPWTVYNYRRWLAHFPFGRKAIADITGREIAVRLKAIEGDSEREHSYRALRTLFRYAEREHLIDRIPLTHVQKPPVGKSRERILTDDEIRALWAATEPSSTFHSIVRLLLLTGQRRGEVAALQWDWIDPVERAITIPASVTKNGRVHTFPYGDLVADHIEHILEMVGCPYLFPARGMQGPYNGWSKSKAALDKASGVTGWVLHDLRRSYASTMQRLGVRIEVTERLLNHASGTQSGIVGVYQRYSFSEEMKDACKNYEHHIHSLVG